MDRFPRINEYSWVFRKQLNDEIGRRAVNAKGVLLDVGCGEKPYAGCFSRHCSAYFGMDLPGSPLFKANRVNVFADATRIPVKDNSIDTVLCFEVLDDIPEPGDLFAEIRRVLKKGGILFLSVPQMWNIHNAPYDFYRYTRHGLAYQAEKHGFNVMQIVGIGGFWARVAAKTFRFLYRFGRNGAATKVIGFCIIPMQIAFYALDRIFFTSDDVICNLMIARKAPFK